MKIWGEECERNLLTVSLQSISERNSRSKILSSAIGIPPTLAYVLFEQKVSHRALEETVIEAMTKRWQVREESVNKGTRAQIWSI